MKSLPVIACVVVLSLSSRAQLFNFTTVAGSAGQGSANGISTNAQFASPGGVAMDPSGNLFVADTANHTIRKITPNGTVSTFAGTPGVFGTNDGNSALFNSPQSVAADNSGNIYVADTGNFTIRKITSGGMVSTLAGLPGVSGSIDGTNATALFFEPEGIAVDGSGNVFVADTWNHTIREVTSAGVVTTIAGSAGNFGSTDASGTNALFYEPQGIAVDLPGNIYVADTGNNTIRKITLGAVSTLAGYAGNFGSANGNGTNASFYSPQGISVDALGNLYIADSLNNVIRQVTAVGTVSTVAGTPGNFGSADGINGSALFWGLQGVAVNPTNNNIIYLADTGNSTVRQLAVSGANYVASTIAGSASIGNANLSGTAARFFSPMSTAVDSSGNIYVADAANNTIRKISSSGVASTLAGSPGIAGSSDGPAASALFNNPQAVTVDSAGNVFVSDTGNSTIREITTGGTVSTLAGSPGVFSYFDGTNSTALLNEPLGIAVDGSDNVYVADSLNQTIRKVTLAGVVTTVAGSVGLVGSADGTNSVARFNHPAGLAIDGSGNLFVTDLYNHTVREITSAGAVTTLAGWAGIYGSADGAGNFALFCQPQGIAVSGTNVFVADSGNQCIRQLNLYGNSWIASTVAGLPGIGGSADGLGIAARFCYPAGLVVKGGNLLVADSGNNTIRSGFMITNTPPVILSQPQSQAVLIGSNVTFNVGATSTFLPLTYQWQYNGSAIPGATSNSLTIFNAQPANDGNYTVRINSSNGSILSSNAVLIVYGPPVITSQPAGQTCLQGTTITLSVSASAPPLNYQWLKNGAPMSSPPNVSGANTATLTISNSTSADDGSYSVLVSNPYFSLTSSQAVVTVYYMPPPDSVQPYAWWLLNEGTGTQTLDYSGNGHNGTLNTGATWTSAGQSGTGIYFNATAPAQVFVANPFIWSGDWTATMWVNRWETKLNTQASVLMGGTHDSLKLEQYAQTNHLGYTVYGTADYPLACVTPLASWVHLAFVKNSTGVSIYTNGIFVASRSNTSSLDVTTLGCDNFTDYLDATLDDVRVYTNALTGPQIASIFAYGRITPIATVSLTAPTNGASFAASSNILLTATVVTNAQAVSGVAFYSGTNLLGQTSVAPFQWTLTNAMPGSYVLTAQVPFNTTNVTVSPVAGITVVPSTNRPSLAFAIANGALQVSWPADHTGWSLQAQTNPPGVGLGTNWATVFNSNSTNQMMLPIVPANGSVFYRMSYP